MCVCCVLEAGCRTVGRQQCPLSTCSNGEITQNPGAAQRPGESAAAWVLGQRLSRSLSTSSHVHLRNRVLEKQKIMQADNGLPVYLKGGMGDLILYRITMAISAVGCSLGLYYIVLASLPKK